MSWLIFKYSSFDHYVWIWGADSVDRELLQQLHFNHDSILCNNNPNLIDCYVPKIPIYRISGFKLGNSLYYQFQSDVTLWTPCLKHGQIFLNIPGISFVKLMLCFIENLKKVPSVKVPIECTEWIRPAGGVSTSHLTMGRWRYPKGRLHLQYLSPLGW